MASNIQKMDLVGIDLNQGTVYRSWHNHAIGMKDNKGDAFGILVYRDKEPVDLTGISVQGYYKNPQGTNIAITTGNTVEGNMAYVVLPQACYDYDGQFTLAIKLIGGGITGTMRIVDGMVNNTNVDGAVAPTGTVPTYQEVLSVFEQMQDALEEYDEKVTEQDGKISGLSSVIDNTEDALYVQKTVSFVSESGVVKADTGENAPSSSSNRTSVDVSDAYRVSFFAHAYSSNYGYAFLDANGAYISGAKTTETGTMNILVPLNAKTFKTCWNSSETQSIILFRSGVADADEKIETVSNIVAEQTDFFLEEQFQKSEYNLIRCLSFEMENPDSGITLTHDRDYVSIQGQISSNQRMLIRVDISELTAGTYYFVPPYDLKGNNTYGIYFADENKTRLNPITYVNNQYFATLTLSNGITGIAYIVVLLACTDNYTYDTSGYVFLNRSTKYIAVSQDGYEPKYKPINLQSVLHGKKWVAIGDSTTTGSTSQSDVPGLTYNWEKLVCDQTGMTCVNLGIPGATTSGFYQAIGDIPSDADIITIMGGINDMSQSVRTEDEAGYEYNSGTYPGSIRRLVKYIVQNFPNAKLILCSCIGGFSKTETGNFDLPVTNNLGKTIEDYANKCKEVAHELSMPFMDVFGDCGISTLNRTTYISDSVHPNVAGYKKLANVFLSYFNSHQDYIV